MMIDADPVLIGDLVSANRILYRHGVVDAFGHVSVRDSRDPDRFLLARNMAPALFHMSSFLGRAVPVFEIRDAAGPDNDLLVRDPALGDALAVSLDAAPAVLMRGHGATIVGADVRQAVFRAIYTAANAALQADAMRLGEVTYLSAEETARATLTNAGQVERAWSLWRQEAQG